MNKLSGKYAAKNRGFENSSLVLNENGVCIAEVFTDREPGDQHQTAALLAAAPDLLAALRAVLHECRLDLMKPTLDQAEGAIAAAEGK